MLTPLSTYAPPAASQRVEPAAAARAAAAQPPDVAGPPRQAGPGSSAQAVAALASARSADREAEEREAETRAAGDGGAPRGDGTSGAAAPSDPRPAAGRSDLAARLLQTRMEGAEAASAPAETSAPKPAPTAQEAADAAAAEAAATAPGRLDEEAQVAVERLSARDREVRAHEMAHVIAGRPWAGPPVYMYQMGPDGRRYAIGGFVPIDTSPVQGNPHATAEKMRVVSEAALAAGAPSAADRRIAAIARARLQEALAALNGAPKNAPEGGRDGAGEVEGGEAASAGPQDGAGSDPAGGRGDAAATSGRAASGDGAGQASGVETINLRNAEAGDAVGQPAGRAAEAADMRKLGAGEAAGQTGVRSRQAAAVIADALAALRDAPAPAAFARI